MRNDRANSPWANGPSADLQEKRELSAKVKEEIACRAQFEDMATEELKKTFARIKLELIRRGELID